MLHRRGWIGVALGVLSCTPVPPTVSEAATATVVTVDEPGISEVEPTTPAVVDIAATPRPQAAHAEPAPGLLGLVQDLAVVLPHGEVVQDSAQCFVGAAWATATTDDFEPQDLAGVQLHVIDPHGVVETTLPPSGRFDETARLRLVTRSRQPWAGARLSDRWLQRRVPDGKRIAGWARAKVGKRLKVVGQIRGTFGDSVDRMVVLAPRRWPTDSDEDETWRISEVVVLVAGDRPTGLLPFTRTFEDDGDDFEPGVYGLQVAGVVDLDGDRIEEVVWSSHPIIEELSTALHVSYSTDGEHRVHELSFCTYWGCNAVLPPKRCRGPVKRLD